MKKELIDKIINKYFNETHHLTHYDKMFFLKVLNENEEMRHEAKFITDIYFSQLEEDADKLDKTNLELSTEQNLLIRQFTDEIFDSYDSTKELKNKNTHQSDKNILVTLWSTRIYQFASAACLIFMGLWIYGLFQNSSLKLEISKLENQKIIGKRDTLNVAANDFRIKRQKSDYQTPTKRTDESIKNAPPDKKANQNEITWAMAEDIYKNNEEVLRSQSPDFVDSMFPKRDLTIQRGEKFTWFALKYDNANYDLVNYNGIIQNGIIQRREPFMLNGLKSGTYILILRIDNEVVWSGKIKVRP